MPFNFNTHTYSQAVLVSSALCYGGTAAMLVSCLLCLLLHHTKTMQQQTSVGSMAKAL